MLKSSGPRPHWTWCNGPGFALVPSTYQFVDLVSTSEFHWTNSASSASSVLANHVCPHHCRQELYRSDVLMSQ